MHIYDFICEYIYIYIYMYIRNQIYIYIHTDDIHIYICVYMYIYTMNIFTNNRAFKTVKKRDFVHTREKERD